jgi:hypothetical protein
VFSLKTGLHAEDDFLLLLRCVLLLLRLILSLSVQLLLYPLH